VACWLLGPKVGPEFGIHMPLGPQDPREPLGAGTPFGVWGSRWSLRSGPKSLLILWPFYRVQVLGPISYCRSSLQHLRLLMFQPLCDQHHAHDFSFSRDVEQHMFAGLRSYHDWQRREVLLQPLECLIYFHGPDKGSGLPQQFEE
jgi:hypothetical protein